MAQFELTTTAQVKRSYTVEADDDDQARKRLRTHFNDPGMLREGLVTELPDKQSDTTTQRIIEINGKPVKDTVPEQAAAITSRRRGQRQIAETPAADGASA